MGSEAKRSRIGGRGLGHTLHGIGIHRHSGVTGLRQQVAVRGQSLQHVFDGLALSVRYEATRVPSVPGTVPRAPTKPPLGWEEGRGQGFGVHCGGWG